MDGNTGSTTNTTNSAGGNGQPRKAPGQWTLSPLAQPFVFQPQQQQQPTQQEQWDYQQMMYNAQLQQAQFANYQAAAYNRNPFTNGLNNQQQPQQPPGGFHPYRRPSRQASGQSASSERPPNVPYGHPSAPGSSSSSLSSARRPRTDSNNSSNSARGPRRSPSSSPAPVQLAPRTASSSSASARPTPPKAASTTPAPSPPVVPPPVAAAVPRPAKPSPLSQSTAAEKRMSTMSKDDSALIDNSKKGGLKNRWKRAFNTSEDPTAAAPQPIRPSPPTPTPQPPPASQPQSSVVDDSTDAESVVPEKKRSRAASLFSSRLNNSTDNLSLASTMSSASMMIRKIGSMGKLASRKSLTGITSVFKNKKDKKDKQKSAEQQAASVDAEEPDWTVDSSEMTGLTPAAKLARQHTLKSKAEAEARAQEAASTSAITPPPWENDTLTRNVEASGVRSKVDEDGTKKLVDEDDSASEDDTVDGQHRNGTQANGWHDEDDEIPEESEEEEEDDHEPWAVDIRRSVERTRTPAKGILKYAGEYNQETWSPNGSNQPANLANRGRSSSYSLHPGQVSEGTPLARIPSPDPDHIDGTRHSTSSSSENTSQLPPMDFGGSESSIADLPAFSRSSIFNNPSFNSSAPALSTGFKEAAPHMSHRSATVSAKQLSFATNLSVYDTFSPSVYDRRSGPATWSCMTPQIAQRVKEELNNYKMEEMEVHATSRIHTQFYV